MEASKVFSHYDKLLAVPFTGITTNGKKMERSFKRQNEGAPIQEMVRLCTEVLIKTAIADEFLLALSADERDKVNHDIDAIEWYPRDEGDLANFKQEKVVKPRNPIQRLWTPSRIFGREKDRPCNEYSQSNFESGGIPKSA